MTDKVDVKAPRGFIPEVPPPRQSAFASHGFFKVFLFVGEKEDEEEMIPLLIEKPQDMLTIQRFVAIPGMKFRCRIELSRAPPEGVQYGCRVYIDKGGLDHRHVFDVARGVTEEQTPINEDTRKMQSVDKSEEDHYFWIGPGETSFTVGGFYCSSNEHYEFKFGKLPKNDEKNFDGDLDELKQEKNQIGILRFQFSKVKSMRNREDNGYRNRLPSQAADYSDGLLYKKGLHLSTQPGKRQKIGRPSKQVAELEKQICYESRVYFNDLYGYQALMGQEKRCLGYVYQEPSRLRALPLTEFRTSRESRFFFLDRFLTWLQQKRYERVEDNHIVGLSVNDCPSSNEAVGTEDLVHFICATLSPAASYILCTGTVRPGNFGEKLVQRRLVKQEDRDSFFSEKEDGLVAFFTNNPDNYELMKSGRDQENRILYNVKKVTYFILDDSDSESKSHSNKLTKQRFSNTDKVH